MRAAEILSAGLRAQRKPEAANISAFVLKRSRHR
jgi:hypothetical protein